MHNLESAFRGHRVDAASIGNGELIGLAAYNAGQLAKELRLSKLNEGNNKAKHPYQITEKGKKYKANPPAEIEAEEGMPTPPSTKTSTKTVSKTVTETVTKTVLPQPPTPEEKETEVEPAITSQANLFRSIGEKLGVGGKKGEIALSDMVCYVQRTGLLNKGPFRAVDQHNRLQPRICHISRGYR